MSSERIIQNKHLQNDEEGIAVVIQRLLESDEKVLLEQLRNGVATKWTEEEWIENVPTKFRLIHENKDNISIGGTCLEDTPQGRGIVLSRVRRLKNRPLFKKILEGSILWEEIPTFFRKDIFNIKSI